MRIIVVGVCTLLGSPYLGEIPLGYHLSPSLSSFRWIIWALGSKLLKGGYIGFMV